VPVISAPLKPAESRVTHVRNIGFTGFHVPNSKGVRLGGWFAVKTVGQGEGEIGYFFVRGEEVEEDWGLSSERCGLQKGVGEN
jgi:hypothetical protein